MNEKRKTSFEPPVLTVLTHIFDQDNVGNSQTVVSWSIGEIPDISSK